MRKWLIGHPFFRALKYRSFALLWGGQALSRVGDFLYQLVLAWWVLEKTGSAALMATVFIVAFIPTILFGLIGGVAVDRYSRVHIMLASDLVRGGVVCIAAALAWWDSLQIWHVYGLTLLLELVDAFFQPAYAAVIPRLVPEADLPSANALTSLSIQTGRIVGPPLGAALIALGGTALAFALNGFSFFIGAALLIPLLNKETTLSPQEQLSASQSVIVDFKEGIRTVLGAPWLWLSIAVFALGNVTLGGPYSIALPFLVEEQLGADVQTLGFLYALFAVGYVLGGLWLGRKAQLQRRGRLIYGGITMAGMMLLLMGLPVGLPVVAVAALLNGVAMEISGLAWTNALQAWVPHTKLGRVTSIDAIGSMALMPIGFGVTGWATELWGAPLVFVLGGRCHCIGGQPSLLLSSHPPARLNARL